MATSNYMLPPPPVLEIHDSQAAKKWKKFIEPGITIRWLQRPTKKSEAVQVAMLLTVIGEEGQEVFLTSTDWTAEGDDSKIVSQV